MENTIFDVADWFLPKSAMTPKKLQKLCYYAEAWSEALLGEPITRDAHFEALVHGPANPELWKKYQDYGWQDIPNNNCQSAAFTEKQTDLLESVWTTYNDLSGTELEALTHTEDPWRNQRTGLSCFQRSHNTISPDDMAVYYKSIYIGD